MTDNQPTIAPVEPFALRPRVAAQLAGVGMTEFYRRLNAGDYETFLDGTARLVTVRSIKAHQERMLATGCGAPRDNKAARRGGPGRPKKKTA
jgi:hypothetical protein